jgi:endonuclease VIII
MPEGPEIAQTARDLSRILLDRPLDRVRFAFPHLKRHQARLAKSRIIDVQARSKALVTTFDCGLAIYSHNQLYGQWHVHKAEQVPDTHWQVRLRINTAQHAAVLYSASEIAVLTHAQIAAHPYIARLGVELLLPGTRLADVFAQTNKPRFARRALADLLLNQAFFAGIGNYLRSDILFFARLHPARRLGELTAPERKALAKAALLLTRQSLATGGITNDRKLAAALKTQGWDYANYRHWVFDRAGAPCHICGTTIERQMISGRQLYLCPQCQPG